MSDLPRVFVTRRIPSAGLDRLRSHCDMDVWEGESPPPREQLLQRVRGCAGLLSLLTEHVNAELMDAAGPGLKVISNFAVGYNNIDVSEAKRRGVQVGNTPDVLTEATADMALTLLLAAGRRLLESIDSVRNGHWRTWDPLGHIGVDLQGKTLGVVGMGRIGAAMARRCRGGWSMRVLYHGRNRKPELERELGASWAPLDELLAEADFVSVHASLNESTQHLFDASRFRKMKPTAVFINTARGPLHVQADLYQALREGWIFAAGLDVTDPEPIPLDDPLLELPNCIIAPHIGSATTSSRNGMAEIAADNIIAGLKDQPLRSAVGG